MTVIWSGDNGPGDYLSVHETPNAKPATPTEEEALVGGAVVDAYLQTRDGLSGFRLAWKSDGCTGMPDSWGSANFYPACKSHDWCYSRYSWTDRRSCDWRFLQNLQLACRKGYGEGLRRSACHGVAKTYYNGVRKAGKSWYNGRGSAA